MLPHFAAHEDLKEVVRQLVEIFELNGIISDYALVMAENPNLTSNFGVDSNFVVKVLKRSRLLQLRYPVKNHGHAAGGV